MYLVYYKISDDYFIIQLANFSIDYYDDLVTGYINREGYILVFMYIYNLYTEQFDIVECYWLWRSCIKLKYG